MGEVIAFPSRRGAAGASRPLPPEIVFAKYGWHILALPSAGRFIAVSPMRQRGVEVGRFDPRTGPRDGSAVAILLRCGSDELLSRCAIAWLNSPAAPRTVILGSFVVAAGGRFHFWRDAIIEVAVIGGRKLVRLVDGSVAIAREPEPEPLIDPFAALARHRRRPAFDRLPVEMRVAPRYCAGPIRWASSPSCSPHRHRDSRPCAHCNPALLPLAAGRADAPRPCQRAALNPY